MEKTTPQAYGFRVVCDCNQIANRLQVGPGKHNTGRWFYRCKDDVCRAWAFEDSFAKAIAKDVHPSFSQLQAPSSSQHNPSSSSLDLELFEARYEISRQYTREKKEAEAAHRAELDELKRAYMLGLRVEKHEINALKINNTHLETEVRLLKQELAIMKPVRTRVMAEQGLPPPYEA